MSKKEKKTSYAPISKTYQRDLAESCEEWVKIYGANKNLYRIMPSMQDGLKPVQRRFLYSLYLGKGRSNFIKMAKAASDTVADFHPHGNVSVEDVGANLANPQSNNICPVEGQGNFGTYKNEKASASRYIECKLSKYALKCFFENFDAFNVDTRDAYTGDQEEPNYLPAKYPHALFNPQLSGIGFGFASNIPPFNVTEVLEATIKLIKNPNAKIFIVPDSPTGADIVDDGQFETICTDGVGTFTLRGHIEVDEVSNTLTITSIPLQTTIDAIIRNIALLKDKRLFDEIISIKDYTKNETGVRTIIQLTQTANPYKTIDKLYRKGTGLKKTYSVGLKMIDDFKDYDYGVISFLKEWIDYRRDCVRGYYNTRLVRAMEEQNINDVLLFILNEDNAEQTIAIAKDSEDRKETSKRLMDKYGINSQQANSISGMQIHAFNRSAYRKYQQKKNDLIEEIHHLETVLDDDSLIDKIIIDELKEGIKLFGRPRKSKIVTEEMDIEFSDTDHILAISKDGFIKKLSLEEKQVGQVGNKNGQYITLKVNNKDNLLIFDSAGIVTRLSVGMIADAKLKEHGVPIERYSPFPINGRVVSVLIEPTQSELKKLGKDLFFAFLTKHGFVKKTLLSEFTKINGSTAAIKLTIGDELVAAEFVTDNTVRDMVIYTNMGNGIRRDINEFSIMKANARGVKQITMAEGEYCVGFDKINPNKDFIFYITSSGRAKMTDMKYFPTMKKRDDAVSLVNLDKNEFLVGICSVSGTERVVAYLKNSAPQEFKLSDMKVSTRVAKAEKVVKTVKGDSVVSYTVIMN